jgi:hypothetical protein
MDFWNFKDFMSVPAVNWLWMLLALFAGLIAGWVACINNRLDAR